MHLQWQQDIIDENEFRKHCIAELSEAITDVLVFKKTNEIITISEFNYIVQSLLSYPKDILAYLPDNHPIMKSYEEKETEGLTFRNKYLYYKLTGDKLLTSQWDKEYFCNMFKLKLGKHYDNSSK